MVIENISGRELTIELSYRCPLKCIHCSSVNIDGELSKLRILDAIEKIKPDYLRLSGGEPLVHDLEKLGVFESGIKIILSTSGIGETRFLRDFDIELARFSIYGDKNFHNYITQEYSYDLTLKVLKDCIALSKYNIQLTTPIFGEKQLYDVINLAENLNVSVRIAKLLPHGRAKNFPEIVLPYAVQLDIASKYLDHPKVIVTDSLLQLKVCNLQNKFTLLPNGKIKSCVAYKHSCYTGNKICSRI